MSAGEQLTLVGQSKAARPERLAELVQLESATIASEHQLADAMPTVIEVELADFQRINFEFDQFERLPVRKAIERDSTEVLRQCLCSLIGGHALGQQAARQDLVNLSEVLQELILPEVVAILLLAPDWLVVQTTVGPQSFIDYSKKSRIVDFGWAIVGLGSIMEPDMWANMEWRCQAVTRFRASVGAPRARLTARGLKAQIETDFRGSHSQS